MGLDRGRCAGRAGRVAGGQLAGAGRAGLAAVAAPVRQLAGAVVVAGIAVVPVAGPVTAAEVAGGRWGPGRGRLRKETTKSE